MVSQSSPSPEPSSDHGIRLSRGGSTSVGAERLARRITRLVLWLVVSQLLFGVGLAVAFYLRDRDIARDNYELCVQRVEGRLETRELFFAIIEPYADTEVARSIEQTIDRLRPAANVKDECGSPP